MYYLIYQITNLINGKIYIGKHQTSNLDDEYFGSGNLIKRAIKKYGKDNFKKEILYFCNSIEEMNNLENNLVTEDFVKRNDTYNITIGGQGGWYHINTLEINTNRLGKKHSDKTKLKMSESHKNYQHSEETKNKISKSHLGKSTVRTEEGRKRQSERQKNATYNKICKCCGKNFVGTGLNSKFCSDGCKNISKNHKS